MASRPFPRSHEREQADRLITVSALPMTGIGTRRTSPQRLSLDAEGDCDAKFLLSLLQHGDHDLRTVVDGEDDVFDPSLESSACIAPQTSDCGH